jgi:hypothetical protein
MAAVATYSLVAYHSLPTLHQAHENFLTANPTELLHHEIW